MATEYGDIIVPPIQRERLDPRYFEMDRLRDALILASRERDELARENHNYRRVIFALLYQMGGETKITQRTLATVPLTGTINSTYDARDKSVTFELKETP